MSIAITVPEVGESITEVEIGEWLKHEGDYVERDDEVVVIETEKATVEIPAPNSGVLSKILKNTGEKAAVNEVIGYLDTESTGRTEKAAPIRQDAPPHQAVNGPAQARQESTGKEKAGRVSAERRGAKPAVEAAPVDRPAARPAQSEPERPEPAVTGQAATGKATGRSDKQTPAIESSMPGQGAAEGSRVHIVPSKPAGAGPLDETERDEARRPPEIQQSEAEFRPAPAAPGARDERAVPMTQLRRRIAERLVQAQQTAALLTTFNEIDMTAVIELRRKYRDSFQDKYRIKLGFMSFFVKAAIAALRRIPEVNAEIRSDHIIYRNYFDVGVAVGGGKGLVVPVLRNAEALSFARIEQVISDFARRAEQNKLKPDELQGGTFTISNGGIYGSLLSTPIVNPPQSGILGLHAIQERPVVLDGAVVIRPMMYVALTYDHRIVDGREAVTFLRHIKLVVEDPARILLEI